MSKFKLLKLLQSWVLVAPACNPSYSGDRSEGCGWKQAQANNSPDPTSEKKKKSQ
jgi:hypothetical protein